jgi:hypothetical protein
MFHPSMNKPEIPLIRRGMAESAALLIVLGLVATYRALQGDMLWAVAAAVAFVGAGLLLPLEVVAWFKRVKISNEQEKCR